MRRNIYVVIGEIIDVLKESSFGSLYNFINKIRGLSIFSIRLFVVYCKTKIHLTPKTGMNVRNIEGN